MKSKASLVLMEQLVMLLVFALAAAFCLQAFVRADAISRQTARRDEAVLIAQSAAEILRATGDPELAKKEAESSGYQLVIEKEMAQVQGLCQATVMVYDQNEAVFSLRTGWQEVGQ